MIDAPDLKPLEARVLDMLLAGDHPVLARLRGQAAAASVVRREYTGVGFFVYFEVPVALTMQTQPSSFYLGDVEATIGGLQRGAGFVLFVTDGCLSNLEGYTYEEPWPAELGHFELCYHNEPRNIELPVLLQE